MRKLILFIATCFIWLGLRLHGLSIWQTFGVMFALWLFIIAPMWRKKDK